MGLDRRDFLVRFCQGAGVTLIPSRLWGFAFPDVGTFALGNNSAGDVAYHLHPHYRAQRPLDAALVKVQAGLDDFITEKYAEQIGRILEEWSAKLLRSPQRHGTEALAQFVADDFLGASPRPLESRVVRQDSILNVRRNKFAIQATLNREDFLRELRSRFDAFSKIVTAEFQVTGIEAKTADVRQPAPASSQVSNSQVSSSQVSSLPVPSRIQTRVRFEIVGTGTDFHREQLVGNWDLTWKTSPSGDFEIQSWHVVDETQARTGSPVYLDVTAAAFGSNSSYSAQMLHGTDYWRTILDGACGIDIYGHNGISVADIDNDGFDDVYVCQPAGLPNRLYRNRGDGTFEDITDFSGLGILENTACALFADFNNDGRQDVVVVRASGPQLFLNDGSGKFSERPDAFRFANPPQGTFTGAAVADYDRDGWLDIYFCLYSYYQGTGQYKYPSPYYDAENGPPNFLLCNQRDGTFRDVTTESGLSQNNTRYSFCCGWSDYNGDGWPDLYVVNDFGRKNLYRNSGNGTFTDVAAQAGVEDVGAGMSVCWFNYDKVDRHPDGAEDLYVANMWTAAGERVSTQDIFKKDSPEEIRALYRKHAMGNSLFRNLVRNGGTAFEDATGSSGTGVGRWSWSSDAFDFDHDGFPDLYVTNGMVSGPLRDPPGKDLNSFFWRQVVANSPDDARAAPDYELGWNAINELIRADGTWSGYERNIFYANNGDGTFSDVSATVGMDFVEDGRSFALADFNHDGRLEIFLKNRNGPQLRLLKNFVGDLPPSIAFRLKGTKSNRDAIGASVTIDSDAGRQTKTLQAGSGFLSQHSKDIFFGLGGATGSVRASIRWPSGTTQELGEVPPNHRVWVEEGSVPPRVEPFKAGSKLPLPAESVRGVEALPEKVESWLLEPFPAPEFFLPDFLGQTRTLSTFRGKPVLLNLWSAESRDCKEESAMFERNSARWTSQGLHLIVVDVDGGAEGNKHDLKRPYLVLRGSDDFAAIYNIVYRQLFDRHRDLTLPTSFLIDAKGDIVKVYQGSIDSSHIEHDFQHIPQNDADRLARALPFPSATHTLEFGRNYLSYGALFFQRGYLTQAEAAFQQALRDDPSSAEALYGIGSVYLNQNRNAAARDAFERAVKLQASYPGTLPDAWNNLGVIATREGQVDHAIDCFQQALKLNSHHLLSLDNLGNAYRLEKHWDEARIALDHALEIAPRDAEANYSLGMVFAQTGDNEKAYEHLQRALQARPDYPEALNNLGVLYLVTQRRDQAVESFEQCIRTAPGFDQAYLNLARVYALEGSPEKARAILLELLQQHPDHAQAKEMLDRLHPHQLHP
ncbi:MAG TPA: FG-GAP-like repeat-containing protein [Terriglobales bacterium]|nr:FG-GAP-like repeat-containing protein [Terriglobales bacterium]